MSQSHDSNVLATIGLGQPRELEALFEYRYYVKEESASDSTQAYRSSAQGVPRKVTISFTAPSTPTTIEDGDDEDCAGAAASDAWKGLRLWRGRNGIRRAEVV